MFSITTLVATLFVFLTALPSIHVSARPSHGRDNVHHRGIADRRPVARSVTRCKARSSSVSVSSAYIASPSSVHTTASATVNAAYVKKTATTSRTSTSTHKTQTSTPTPTTTTHETTTQTRTTTHKTTTTTAEASTTSTASSSSSTSGFYSGENTGEATYYNTGLGACGFTDSDSTSYIAAMSVEIFDNYPNYDGTNPNNNPLCKKKVKATYNGKSVTVAITDRCTGCSATDLDFSPLAFQELAELSVGRLTGMTWEWVS
ncbi:RlpA-like double-psi beta-barrel-protein domain-containing protein-containing protein [Mycena vulgaris]|nr:RlpA-like double-psi beta-barrel-protein domain-containing protein-containing protein [Mycena vulgaris]